MEENKQNQNNLEIKHSSPTKNVAVTPDSPAFPNIEKSSPKKTTPVIEDTKTKYPEVKDIEVKDPETKPSKIETISSKNVSPQKFLMGFLIFSIILLAAFYALVFWGTYNGSASNPLFETLNIEAGGLKSLLMTMTTTIFGVITLVLLISTLIALFQSLVTEKDEKNKKNLLAKSGIYFFMFLFICGVWVFLYWFITNLNGDTRPQKTDSSLIITNPQNVIGLSTPIQIEFNIGEKLFEKIDPKAIRQISWDFDGDNIFDASGPNVTHRFTEKGERNGRYPVTAKIDYFAEKEAKEVSFFSIKEVIISNEAVSAALSASPDSGPFPLTVEFNALESRDPDGEIILYEWDLDGDGEFEVKQENPTIEKTFTQVGEYKIKLRVTGSNHDIDIFEQVIKVKSPEGNLRSEITAEGPTEGIPPLKIALDGSHSFVKEGQITRFEWLVEGDSEVFVGRKFQRVFRKSGEYKISLTIQNDLGERHKTTKKIKVLPDNSKVEVKIKTTPSVTRKDGILRGMVPFNVTFDSAPSDIRNAFEWQWDFENDGIADQFSQAVKYTFRDPGLYEVKLTIIDSTEEVHEKIQKVMVERSGTRAKINAAPSSGEIPLQVTFDGSGSSTDEGEIVDYIWEFPNTNPLHYGSQITYLFKQIGNIPVRLTILTSKGKTATTETLVSVRVPIIKSNFKFIPKTGKAPLTVELNPSASKGLVHEYFWDFGDGYSQKQMNANPITHEYKKAGTYKINLKLVDQNNLVSESSKEIVIK